MLLSVARLVLALGFVVVSVVAVPASANAQDEKCGVRVDFPHPSYMNSAQIHTRVEAFCGLVPLESNQVSATMYRLRWYGWERMADKSGGPKVTSRLRITVAADCEPDTKDRWKTEARGIAVIAGRTYSAGAYQETDSAITCKR
jgi:hypothetical protein